MGRLKGLLSPVAVGRRRVTIRRGLLARLPRRIEVALELGEALSLLTDRVIEGQERGTKPVLFVFDGLPLGGPLPGGLLMACELRAQRRGHRLEAREELPPLGNGVAKRAGKLWRVRHAPITAGGAGAGASAQTRRK